MHAASEMMNHLPGYIGWKDKNSHFLGCNENFAEVFQIKVEEIKGLKDIDLLGCTEEIYNFHLHNDRLALNGKIVKSIHKSSFPYDGSLFYFVKKPITDVNKNITGIIFCCHEFINSNSILNLYQIDKKNCPTDLLPKSYEIAPVSDPFQLSSRELECLFCVLRGASGKQIAEILELSRRTVESYLENIKNKFNCNNKSQLLALAIQAGYMHIIPQRFLHFDLSNFI